MSKQIKSGIDLKQFRKYLIKYYGKKCKSYAIGCFTCQVWRVYENLKQICLNK